MNLTGLLNVNTRNVRQGRSITIGRVVLVVVRNSSVNVMVVARVLIIRFRGLLIVCGRVTCLSRLTTVENDCLTGPNANITLLSL